jgi:surface protein
VVGLVFLFFVAPFSLLAVFQDTSAFNQDVSNWNTGAVTTMEQSKCTLSPSLCGHGAFRCGVLFEYIYDNSRFVGAQVSHVLFFFFCLWFETGPLLLLFVWWVWFFLFGVAPFSLLAVFRGASAFNSDVSNWNTGAVTDMKYSKCTLSLSLLATAPFPLWCVVEYIHVRHLEVRRVTSLTRFFFFFVDGNGTLLLLFVWWDLVFSFLCCTLFSSCSVLGRSCVQFRRVQLEHGGGDKYVYA